MTLGGIRPGDIVRVDDGLVWFAEVVDKVPKGLKVRAVCGKNRHARRVKAREVVGHWKKTGSTRRREEARVSE